MLRSGAALGDIGGVPGFVGQRQQRHDATVSITVRYDVARNGDRAGLAAIQNDGVDLFLCLTRIAGRRVVALYVRSDEHPAEALVASAPVARDRAALGIAATGGTMAFLYGAMAANRTLPAKVGTRLLSTHRAGGCVDTMIGSYVHAVPASK